MIQRWNSRKSQSTGKLFAASVTLDGLESKWEKPLTFEYEYARLKICLSRTGAQGGELLLAIVTDNRLARLCPFCGAEQWAVEVTDPTPFAPVGLTCMQGPNDDPVLLLATGRQQEDWILLVDGRNGTTQKKVPDPHPSENQSSTSFGNEMHPANNGKVFVQLQHGMYGFLDVAGRLQIPSNPPTMFGWMDTPMTSTWIRHQRSEYLVIAVSPWANVSLPTQIVVIDPKTTDVIHQAWNHDFAPE